MSTCCSNYPVCKCQEEKVKCECGKEVPLSEARMDDDANWYCPSCIKEMNEKIITYHIDAGDGELISVVLLDGLEYEGCLQNQIEKMIEDGDLILDEDGEYLTFTVTVKRVLTEREVMDLPEKQ